MVKHTHDKKTYHKNLMESSQKNTELTTTAANYSTQSKFNIKLLGFIIKKDPNVDLFLNLVFFTQAGHLCSLNKKIFYPDLRDPYESRAFFYPNFYDKSLSFRLALTC